MIKPSVVVICMPERGHLQLLLPVVRCLAQRGRSVSVFTDRRFADAVRTAAGTFFDLFADGPLDEVDSESIPFPKRYVTFAACRAESLVRRVAALRPELIIYETFSVIAPVVAGMLGVPAVNFLVGHAMVPSRMLAAASMAPGAVTSAACTAAVECLQNKHAMRDASPFAYLTTTSRLLNLYGEPPAFLKPEDRPSLEPLAFFGCLDPELHLKGSRWPIFFTGPETLRVYVSFGTVVWRYHAAAAEAVLGQIADEMRGHDVEIVVSAGAHPLKPVLAGRLAAAGLRVEPWVHQWDALREADLFVTHHGINSTHEAIWNLVPMLSCPFFSDQPALAERCREFGLAKPLLQSPAGLMLRGAFSAAVASCRTDAVDATTRLQAARTWEVDVIEGRDDAIDRMLSLR